MRRWPVWLVALAGVAVLAGVASVTSARRDRGPDPAVAVVAIDPAPTSATPARVAPPADPAQPPAAKVVSLEPQTPSLTGSAVEMQNGVKIVRLGPAASSASISLPVEPEAVAALSRAPDPRLVEKTADGPLPRIGSDGRRPADVYGRPAAATSGPRVALLVTGMGLDQMATAAAARRLPADVSFAFAPGTADAGAQVAEARRAGHEVFLDLTPGPDPASGDATVNGTAALHRSMARLVGYAGALLDAQSPDTVVRDFAGRGIQPLFDASGAAPAGLAPSADVLLDAAAMAGGLDRLVALAQAKGSAVAVIRDGATAQDALTTLAAGLAARGVTLVPVTSLTNGRTQKAGASKASASGMSSDPAGR